MFQRHFLGLFFSAAAIAVASTAPLALLAPSGLAAVLQAFLPAPPVRLPLAPPFAPVTDFVPDAYLGRWYQVFSDLAVAATFENNSFCVTADYGRNENDTISVLNRERQYSVDGPERDIYGWADQPNKTTPGELEVHLQTTGFPAPYWIFELGPMEPMLQWVTHYELNGKQLGPIRINGSFYSYSVVSDPLHLTLFVLARNVTVFQNLYQEGVLQRLTAAGYTTWLNEPLPTVQEGCVYW